MTPSPPSTRAWSVAKLTALNFEGDAGALAAYVDALVENNRESENADPKLLREQATSDLADFLGQPSAKLFVDGLMLHLASPESPSQNPTQPAQPPAPTTPPSQTAKPPATRDRIPARHTHSSPKQQPSQPKQSVISRLGDRVIEQPKHSQQRQSRDRRSGAYSGRNAPPPAYNSRNSVPGGIRDRLGNATGSNFRGVKRGRDSQPDESRERDYHRRRAADGSDSRAGARGSRLFQLRGERGGRMEDGPGTPPERRGQHWGDNSPGKDGGKEGRSRAPPFGFPPMMSPDMMLKMGTPPPFPGMMPPPPEAIMAMQQYMGRDGGRGGGVFRGRGRGRDGRGGEVRTGNGGSIGGKKQYSVLAMRNVPEDKLKLPHLLKFFEMYGTPDNVQLVTPDRAFIIYSRREPALAAVNSVDAVMGNRHIRLGWATRQDYEIAGLELTEEGVLKPKTSGTGGRNVGGNGRQERGERRPGPGRRDSANNNAENELAAKKERERELEAATQKAAEEDLMKKRQAILEKRAEQEERKAGLVTKRKQLMEDQKAVFGDMEGVADAAAKMELLKKAKAIDKELVQINAELNPATATKISGNTEDSTVSKTVAGRGGRGRGRGRSGGVGRFDGFSVDNRPRSVQIMGALPTVNVETAKGVFHDTVEAEKVGAFWVVKFASRRAAESALRARGPLKRGFGPGAMARIVAGEEGGKEADGDGMVVDAVGLAQTSVDM